MLVYSKKNKHSYHPHPLTTSRRTTALNKISPVTQRTIVVTFQVPLLKAFLVKHVQAFEFPDLLGVKNGVQADDAI